MKEVIYPLRPSDKTTATPFPKDDRVCGRLIWGDNLEAMDSLIKAGLSGRIKLIYIDPPFATGTGYTHRTTVGKGGLTLKRRAYSDSWDRGLDSYLEMLEPRLALMRELLEPKGTIFVHCDWRVNAYIRVLMDRIFGRKNFLNEIVWHYGGRGAKAVSGQFPRNHDTILVYGKGPGASLKKLYAERLLTEREALSSGYRVDDKGRFFKTAPRGDYTDESIRRLEEEGRIYRTRNGTIRIKYFLEKRDGSIVEKKLIGDVWEDIPDVMHCPPAERTAYGTQKPAALISRIIEAGTEPGELVADFFAGSGTTGSAAERLKRPWIMCEQSVVGLQVARARLVREGVRPFVVEGAEGAGGTHRKPSETDLLLKGPVLEETDGKRVSAYVGLKGYKVDAELLQERFSFGKDMEALVNEPSGGFRHLIDYWDVDWDHDGRVFRSMWQSARPVGRGGGLVDGHARAELERRGTKIAVRVIDVFGHETIKVMEA